MTFVREDAPQGPGFLASEGWASDPAQVQQITQVAPEAHPLASSPDPNAPAPNEPQDVSMSDAAQDLSSGNGKHFLIVSYYLHLTSSSARIVRGRPGHTAIQQPSSTK